MILMNRQTTGTAMLLLASESPRRRALLKRLEIPFKVQSPEIEELEQPCNGCSVSFLPAENARRKAFAVSSRNPSHTVIGADTAILFEDRMIGKPRDLEDAKNTLLELAGKTHRVITGLAVIRQGKNPFCRVWSEESRVTFKPFSEQTAERYLELVHVLDKAGSYAIQEHGELIVQQISGSMENIIGLPLEQLRAALIEAGFENVCRAELYPSAPSF